MNLQRLSLWKHHDGDFEITVEFKDDRGNVRVKLPPDLNERILAVCADELSKAVGRAADELRTQIIQQAQQALPSE